MMPVIDYLQSYSSLKPSVNCWRRQMNRKTNLERELFPSTRAASLDCFKSIYSFVHPRIRLVNDQPLLSSIGGRYGHHCFAWMLSVPHGPHLYAIHSLFLQNIS